MTLLLVILGLLALLAVCLGASYNRFVGQRNLVQESWRQIDVELRRRHDLIPNLVQTVQGFAAHERGVLESVVRTRTAAQRVQEAGEVGPRGQAQVEDELGGALHGLLAVAEGYPRLTSSGSFMQLARQLEETEDRLAAGRRFYNANVRALNTRVEAFPSNLVAAPFGFERAEYFEVTDARVRAPLEVDVAELDAPAQPGPGWPAGEVIQPGAGWPSAEVTPPEDRSRWSS